jgi:multicomponent Na+:H+ antiporter subunit A
LALSVLTTLGGVAVFLSRHALGDLASRIRFAGPWGPENWYGQILAGLNATARGQTAVLQNGYLRYYLLTVMSATVLAVGVPLAGRHDFVLAPRWSDFRFYELALALLILLATAMAIFTSSRLGAVTALGVVGYSIALLFILFGAPDVAMTQFLIETLMVILFVSVFYFLPRYTVMSSTLARWRDAVVALFAGALMTALTLVATSVQFHQPIADFFAQQSVPLAHGRNIVNVILVDFRGFDTLGEITVLSVAGVGVYALLKLKGSKAESS